MSEASSCGIHFMDLYRTCQRKWFFKYVLKIDPPVKRDALSKGEAWHAMLEALLTEAEGTTWDSVLQIGTNIYRSPLWTVQNLEQWASVVRYQLPPGELRAVEGEVQFPLANGVLVTARIDGLWQTTDGKLFVLEHKTTSYRTDAAVRALEQGDQLSMYMLACQRLFGRCDGVYADVTLFPVKDKDSDPETFRSKGTAATTTMWLLTRSQDDLVQFELGLIGTWRELRNKLLTLDGGVSSVKAEMLFPRCPNSCSTWSCDYENTCRAKLCFESVPTETLNIFKQEEVVSKLSVDSKQYDFEGVSM